MTDSEIILKRIETVNVNDKEALDRLDVDIYEYIFRENGYQSRVAISLGIPSGLPQYTRSRDTLKAIRPEGWTFRIFQDMNLKWQACLYKTGSAFFGGMTIWFPTEELAELHTVIQAIAHERQ
ncbi:hypothetical protein [Dyadobacter psychrotolerans]|uniref:Uncharacterized protein n=1 Tax=Dyadobacter psychrotolerans TaxID=2541721 RepID=A0A4R5DTJ2_9BACT|nr:hypothetical protein [Dyadobacter psychrotolerans]TDE17739.1 hypothetical protein E0F88_07560 [Dyadobacter psychrotolerans]